MKIAALILGVVGGIFGLFGSCTALTVGALGSGVGAENATTVIGLGWAALALSILGLVGAALAMAKPKLSGGFMLVAGIGGLIAVSAAYIVAAPLLFIAGLLAFFAKPAGAAPTQLRPAPLVSGATHEPVPRFCPHCGAQNSDQGKFCAACGKEVAPAPPTQ